ncbi:TMEM43 family protein [Phreatobacter stygius]|uniref:Uncharacterized protein n=1 Tax=Phreatobacter stygius TaxID=1940610 RepID=A0A4D7AVX7_9HYPH|nr:TMEM43 family protein [Phreatobacter stygius]QCI63705.1 hypothetical protein E8M01_05290 [Phreatobacter stygius]
MSMDSDNNWSSATSSDSSGSTTPDGDSTTEHVGFFQRLMQSLVGILVGIALVGATIWGLFWNEGRAIGTTRALNEGAAAAISVPAARVDPANEGRLIHLTGDLRAGAPLADEEFRIRTQAVRLERRVEMYQWKEEQKTESRSNTGGSQTRTTTYTYEQVWSDRSIDSSRFRQRDGHSNPRMPIASRTQVAPNATLGQFRADERVIGLFGRSAERSFALSAEALQPFTARFGDRARLSDGSVYVGDDPQNPRIGDIRIRYSILAEGPVSVVARQIGSGLTAYVAQNGREVFLGETGTKSAAELFTHAHEANGILTWILRAVALLVMWIGWFLVFRPFVILADIIPILGSAMAAGAGLVALALTLVVYLPVIALAWFWHRPVMSIALIAAGLAGAYGLRWLGQQRRAAKAAAAPVQQGLLAQPYPGQGYPAQGYPAQGYPANAPMPAATYPARQAYPPQPGYQQPQAYPAPGQAAPASFLNVPPELGSRGGQR